MSNIGNHLYKTGDTDSVSYKWPSDRPLPYAHGNALGDLDPVYNEKQAIQKFCSCGSKTYAVVIKDTTTGRTKECIKAKGFRMTTASQKELTFEKFQSLVNDVTLALHVNYPVNFKRSLRTLEVTTVPLVKKLRNTLDKRFYFILVDRHLSLPWGSKLCPITYALRIVLTEHQLRVSTRRGHQRNWLHGHKASSTCYRQCPKLCR